MEYKVILEKRTHLGEGIWWDDRRSCFFWVDILDKELHMLKDGNDRLIKTFDDYVGFSAPCEDGRLLVGCGRELLVFDPETLETERLCSVDTELADNRFNDAKCTPSGRLMAGTMNNALNEDDVEGADTGCFYRIETGKEPARLMSGMTVPNGLAFSSDGGTMYHTDTFTQTVFAYDCDRVTGKLSNKRPAVYIPPETGAPDGMTIAADGTLFIAIWGGGSVKRFDPENGKELMNIELPAKHATCCCFGGEKLDELYINTSSIDAPESELPLAGSIFAVKPGICGVKADRFKI